MIPQSGALADIEVAITADERLLGQYRNELVDLEEDGLDTVRVHELVSIVQRRLDVLRELREGQARGRRGDTRRMITPPDGREGGLLGTMRRSSGATPRGRPPSEGGRRGNPPPKTARWR